MLVEVEGTDVDAKLLREVGEQVIGIVPIATQVVEKPSFQPQSVRPYAELRGDEGEDLLRNLIDQSQLPSPLPPYAVGSAC